MTLTAEVPDADQRTKQLQDKVRISGDSDSAMIFLDSFKRIRPLD
jgi:hypothetical protein